MQTVKGVIREIFPVVVEGNTTYCFTLAKGKSSAFGQDEFFDGVFYAPLHHKPLSALILRLAMLKPGAVVNVQVDEDRQLGTAGKVNLQTLFAVISVA